MKFFESSGKIRNLLVECTKCNSILVLIGYFKDSGLTKIILYDCVKCNHSIINRNIKGTNVLEIISESEKNELEAEYNVHNII